MKCSGHIVHHPYVPPTQTLDAPYICRLAPSEQAIQLEWFDKRSHAPYTLFYAKRHSGEWSSVVIEESCITIGNLSPDTDYELFIEDATGRRSRTRPARTGRVPEGTSVINYLHPEDEQYLFSGKYLCSPSIVRTASGRLIAGMDVFGPSMGQNTMLLFYSDDDGDHWRYLCDLYPFYWANLFFHQNAIYVMGVTTEYGNLQISRSTNDGMTWEDPTTLLYGANLLCATGGVAREPMHLTEFKGRFYTACGFGSWKSGGHVPCVLSVDVNADLMVASNWTCSAPLHADERWYNDIGKRGEAIEGNLVVYPDGKLYDCLRWRRGEMLRLRVDTENPDAPPAFVSIDYAPVSNSLFRIIPIGKKYLLITNRKSVLYNDFLRNVLSLYESDDLKHFSFIRDIVNFEEQSPRKYGFQYPSFALHESTLYVTIRSAFNNADSFHNSNYMLFYKTELPKERFAL